MHIQCPACHTQLNIAGVNAAQVQCPGCGTVLDISGFLVSTPAAQPQAAAHVRPMAQPVSAPRGVAGGMPGGAGAAGSYGAAASASASSPSSASRFRRKKSLAGLWIAGGLAVVVAAAGTWFVLSQVGGSSGAQQDPPAVKQARVLVAQELGLPSEAQFAREYQAQQAKNGSWVVSSYFTLPMRDRLVKKEWKVELAAADDRFVLRSLVVDNKRQTIGGNAQPVALNAGNRGAEGPPEDASTPSAPSEDRTIGGAVDRLAREISAAIKQRKTLVVWLVDHSASADFWRQSFAQHTQTVLDLLRNDQCSMAVVGFGQEVDFLVKEPSRDAAVVRQALESSPDKPASGERVFQAIKTAAETYRTFREEGGYVFFVVVSDEAGDDPELADEVIVTLKRDSSPVYVIGKEAPLGRTSWETTGAGQGGPEPADRITQGPESQAIERIALSFWNQGYSDPGVLSSGYGPFALTKLCLQTGGEYLICEGAGSSSRGSSSSLTFRSWSGSSWGGGGGSSASYQFPASLRRKYAPDYVSDTEYQALLQSNAACQALVNAGKLPQVDVATLLTYDFQVTNEAALKRALDDAQRGAARLEPRLSQLYDILAAGERDRAKLQSPRWQASYDLAMGRALAARARIEGYNAMLAQLKLGKKFENENSSHWILDPADTLAAGSNYEKMITQAKMYLQRVVDDHAGTPWAYLAQRELESKMGWAWNEK